MKFLTQPCMPGRLTRTALATGVLLALAACGGSGGSGSFPVTSTPTTPTTPTTTTPAAAHPSAADIALKAAFKADNYTTIQVTIDGVATPVRKYTELVYVNTPSEHATSTQNPNKYGYQALNVYVLDSVAKEADQSGHAIFLMFNNSGWLASYVSNGIADNKVINTTTWTAGTSPDTDAAGAALAKGYVVVSAGTRSRGFQAVDGSWQGKSPTAVVDAKAAIRYLRLIDDALPGNSTLIVVNGTSGGGAQVSAVGATADSADYYPYLKAAGSAGFDENGNSTLSDAPLAVAAYCPITDLGHADMHYEWVFGAFGARAAIAADITAGTLMTTGGAAVLAHPLLATGNVSTGTATDPSRDSNYFPTASSILMGRFVNYQNNVLGKVSGLDVAGLKTAFAAEVARAADSYEAAGNTIPTTTGPVAATGLASGNGTLTLDFTWLTKGTDGKHAVDLTGYTKFLGEAARLKPAPAFDQQGLKDVARVSGNVGGESNLFGTTVELYSNFGQTDYGGYSWDNNDTAGDGIGADDDGRIWAMNPRPDVVEQTRLINPFAYIGQNAHIVKNWRVRVGTQDRDTAPTVGINLRYALKKAGLNVSDDFLAWGLGHAGNYDVTAEFKWIDGVVAAAKK